MTVLHLHARVRAVNKVIAAVAAGGGGMFNAPGHNRTAVIGLDRVGQVWYVDEYTGAQIYPFGQDRWPGFTGGAVQRQLVEQLALFVRNDAQVDLAVFDEPWGGYSAEERASVHDLAVKLGVAVPPGKQR